MYLQHSHSEIEYSAIGPRNSLSLDDVTHAIQSNNVIDYSEHLRTALNNTIRASQGLSLETKLLEFNNRFNVASDAVRARMLQDMDRGMHMLTREEQNIARIQDPSEIRGQRGRTFGKGGPCRRTAAEIAENELKKSDRRASRTKQSSRSELRIIDVTGSFTASQQHSGPERPTSSALASSMPQGPDVMNPDEIEVLPIGPKTHFNAHSTQTRRKRRANFQIKLVQPIKRVRKEKRG